MFRVYQRFALFSFAVVFSFLTVVIEIKVWQIGPGSPARKASFIAYRTTVGETGFAYVALLFDTSVGDRPNELGIDTV